MKITFVLPFYNNNPIGGYKVVYEYANRLCQRGHCVTVFHPYATHRCKTLIDKINRHRVIFEYKYRWRINPIITWFPVESGVHLLLKPDMQAKYVPCADIIVATNWQTAEAVQDYPVDRGAAFYNLYDYEIWKTTTPEQRERMDATYRAGLNMIATSPAVQQMLEENGVSPLAYIPCGIDFAVLKVETPIAARAPHTIGFQIRQHETKGTRDVLDAVTRLRKQYGEALRFKAFGQETNFAIPDWVEVIRRPTDAQLREFYNSLSIFLFPSHYEGWGLPGCEAMACGAALVTTDSVGNRDYAIDRETALVVERQRPDLLAQAAGELLQNDALRQRLARQGHQHVQQYTWERAVDSLEKVFAGKLAQSSRLQL